MGNQFRDKYGETSACIILTDISFNIIDINGHARNFFNPDIIEYKKINLATQFGFSVVNISNDILLEILTKKRKWIGKVSLSLKHRIIEYYDAKISLNTVKNKPQLLIQINSPKNNQHKSDSDLLFNNHFKKILNASSEGYALMSKDYIIESINKRAQQITRITHGQSMQVGHSMFEYLPEAYHGYCIGITEKVLSGEKVRLTTEYPGLKGKKTYLVTNYLPAYDNEGNITGVIIHTVDNSEQYYSKLLIEQSAIQMRSILNSTNEGIAMISLDYKLLEFNEKMSSFLKTIFKINKKGKIGTDFFEYIRPERKELIKQVFDRVISGEKIDLQQKFYNKWMLASYTPIRDKEEKVFAVCISIRDITEIIGNQKLLEHREVLYNTTLNNIAEAVVLLDNQFRIQHINQSAEFIFRIFNYRLLEPIKLSLKELGFKAVNSQDNYILNQKNWIKIIEQKNDVLLFRIQNNSRKVYLLNISVVNNNEQNLPSVQYVISMRDITRIEKMSEKIDQLSMIAMNISNGVIITDKDGYIQWVNNAFTKITEYTFGEVIGKQASNFLEGQDTDIDTARMIQYNVRNKTQFTCEILNYKKGGSKVWIELSIQPILDVKGKLIQVYALQTDITERKNLEKQLEDERKENQQNLTRAVYKAYEEERSFLGKELHDSVNQKLTASVFNLSKYIKANKKEPELVSSTLQLVKDSMIEIRNLSRRLVATEFLHIGFEDAIKQITFSTAQSITDFKSEVNISHDCELLLSDDLKVNIFRIIQEQMQNIVKHSNASRVNISASVNKENILSLITIDNGDGFDMLKNKDGIGLMNIKNRVESFNGKCEIVSAPGKGCEFRISFKVK